MRRAALSVALALLSAAPGCGGSAGGEGTPPAGSDGVLHGSEGFGPGMTIDAVTAQAKAPGVPHGPELAEVVRVGARATAWAELLQKDTPADQRSQAWRRDEAAAREPTPAKPLITRASAVLEGYAKWLGALHPDARATLEGTGPLPAEPPKGVRARRLVAALLRGAGFASPASRWLHRYAVKDSLRSERHDFRPWLRLGRGREAFADTARSWSRLSRGEREGWSASVRDACAVGTGSRTGICALEADDVMAGRGDALEWLQTVLHRGQERYDSRFKVLNARPGVKPRRYLDGLLRFELGFVGVPADTLAWLNERMREAWVFPGVVEGAVRGEADPAAPGAVTLEWRTGTTAHVVGGARMVLNPAQPLGQERTRATVAHELGHVLGFPDCYSEFWDPVHEEFVYYVLDPANRMCALSGGSLEAHARALVEAYPASVGVFPAP